MGSPGVAPTVSQTCSKTKPKLAFPPFPRFAMLGRTGHIETGICMVHGTSGVWKGLHQRDGTQGSSDNMQTHCYLVGEPKEVRRVFI